MRLVRAGLYVLYTLYVLYDPPRAMAQAAPPALVDAPTAARLEGRWAGMATHEGDSTFVALAFERGGGDTLWTRLWFPALNLYARRAAPVRTWGDGFGLREVGMPLAFSGDSLRGQLMGDAIRIQLGRAPAGASFPAQPVLPDTTSPGADARPRVAWRYAAGSGFWASPTVADHVVYAGDAGGKVHAVALADGRARWTFDAGGAVFGAPVVTGDAVYVAADPNVLWRLDRATGKPRWSASLGVPPAGPRGLPKQGGTDFDDAGVAPLVVGNTVYVGAADSAFYAIDAATGRVRWSYKTGGKVRSTACADARRVYFGSFDHQVYALDRATGTLAWKFDGQSDVTYGPCLAAGRVVVGVRDVSNLYALDAATGKLAWKRFLWLSWVDSTPRLVDGVLYLGSSDSQRVRALDPRDGRTLWERWVGGWAWGTPLVVGDTVYYGTAGGDGYFEPVHASIGALDRATGAIRWRIPFANDAAHWPCGVASSLAYGDGLVIATDLWGGLTAYRTGR